MGESIWPKELNSPRLTTIVSAAANAAPAATPKVRPSIMSSKAGRLARNSGPTCLSTSLATGTSSTRTSRLVQRTPPAPLSPKSTLETLPSSSPACQMKVNPTPSAAAAPMAPITTPSGWSSHWLTSYM